jgi:Protein of unknown function (DUF551)
MIDNPLHIVSNGKDYEPYYTNVWIKTSDKLPEQRQNCWIYAKFEEGSYVMEGYFDLKSHDFRGPQLKVGPGWEYDTDRSDYVMLDQVSHWMPFYTPMPPHDEMD